VRIDGGVGVRVMRLALVGLLSVPTVSGCKAFETNLQDTEVDYLATARQNFEAAEAAFEKGEFNDAIKFFEYVKNKYPYSKYAELADLRIADAHFEREEWLESADAYRMFIRFHPRHEKVPYATYRVALSFYKKVAKKPFAEGMFADVPYLPEIAESVSPFPPTRERDQSATSDAIRAFDDYINRYPDDENVEAAKAYRTEARMALAEHDLYAAGFNEQFKKWQGAIWRYQYIADTFGDTPLAPEALLKAGTLAEEKLEDREQAIAYYERLMKDYPDASEAATAKARLESMPPPASEEKADAPPAEGGAGDEGGSDDAESDDSDEPNDEDAEG